AYLHYLRGEYTVALEILRRTRQACRDNSDAYHWALCNMDQSTIYLELNLIKEGEELAREASVQFQKLSLSYESMRALTKGFDQETGAIDLGDVIWKAAKILRSTCPQSITIDVAVGPHLHSIAGNTT